MGMFASIGRNTSKTTPSPPRTSTRTSTSRYPTTRVAVGSTPLGSSALPPIGGGMNWSGGAPPWAGGATGAPGASSASVSLSAQTNPQFEALNQRYNQYLSGLEGGTGRIMDVAGSRIRDAREGGKRALTEGEAIRGVGSSNAAGNYEADTTRQVTGAVTDLALGREAMMGDAIRGGESLASAPVNASLAERRLQLDAAAAEKAAAADNFQRFMALLNAQRNSPLNQSTYTGF